MEKILIDTMIFIDTDMNKHILLKDLEVYQLARNFSRVSWRVYEKMSWQEKKVIGDQFITAADSVGANIAEGYSRFHHLDRIKFLYVARASLAEAFHWIDLMRERSLVSDIELKSLHDTGDKLSIKLQNFIKAIYKVKNES